MCRLSLWEVIIICACLAMLLDLLPPVAVVRGTPRLDIRVTPVALVVIALAFLGAWAGSKRRKRSDSNGEDSAS